MIERRSVDHGKSQRCVGAAGGVCENVDGGGSDMGCMATATLHKFRYGCKLLWRGRRGDGRCVKQKTQKRRLACLFGQVKCRQPALSITDLLYSLLREE